MSGKPWRSVRYIDLFAGPGKSRIRENEQIVLGSPLIALTTSKPFTDYIFVDLSNENISALRTRCQSRSDLINMQYLVGDSNTLVKSVVDEILEKDRPAQEKWPSINLALLDPEGLELEWQTVATIAQIKKVDLIIHYSQFGLTRNMENFARLEESTIIDKFFGDEYWRNIYESLRRQNASNARIHRDLIDYYKSKLANLGYVSFNEQGSESEPLIRNAQNNAPLYRLLFASKNKLGNKFWAEATKKNVYGQRRLL